MSFFQNDRFSNFLHLAMAAPFGLAVLAITLRVVTRLV